MIDHQRRRLLGWTAAAALAGAHVHARHSDPGGILLVADHLFTIAAVIAMLTVAAAVGRALLARLGVEPATSLDALLFSVAVGLGVLATALLLCGALRILRPAVIVPAVALLAVAMRRQIAALRPVLRRAAVDAHEMAGTPALVVSAVIVVAMLVQSLAPPTDYDSLMYHLEIPATFLARHSVHMPDANPLHVAAVGLSHLLFVPLLGVGAPAGPAVLSTALAVGFALALVATARVALAPSGSRITLLVLWGSPIVALVAMTPKVDVTLAFYLALAHHALVLAWTRRERAARYLVMAAVLLGLGTGVKYLALPFAVAVAPVVLAIAWVSGRSGRERVGMLAVPAAAFLLAAAPWLMKNQALLGAPLYPYFSDRIPAPWLSALYEGGTFPAGIDSSSVRPLRAVRESFNLVDWFRAPERLTPESEARFYRANPLFALAPAALLFARSGVLAVVIVPAALYFAVLLALGTSINLRYLIPATGSLTLLSAHVLAVAMARIRPARGRAALVAAIGIVALSASATALWHRVSRSGAVAHAAGLVSRHEYRQSSRDAEIRSYTELTDAVNAAVPPDARLLLLFEGRGYYFAPTVVQDNVLTNWVYLEPVVGSRCLEGARFTHVLVGTGTLDYFRRRGLDERLIRWDRFAGFAARCLDPVSRTPNFELYRVRPR